jgi:hypothetical protein
MFLGCIFTYAQGSTDSTNTPSPSPVALESTNSSASNNEDSSGDTGNDSEATADKNFGQIFDGASVTFSLGTNYYFGDLADYSIFPRLNQMKEYYTPAFKFSIARDIKWGLGAKLSYQKGSLIGTRKTGKNSTTKSFENNFYNLALQVRYDVGSAIFKMKKETRLKLYATVGIGYMWYRSQLYDSRTLNTKDFEGYIESENTQGTAQKTLSDKVPTAKALTIPYGISATYKLSHKIDLHFDITQTSTFTDRLDAFNRSWTAKDKYNYMGIGLTYNFNRTLDDAPKKRKKKTNESNIEDEKLNKVSKKKKGLFGSKKKQSKEDELLNVRLKLFETQLKLFELQYLIGQ